MTPDELRDHLQTAIEIEWSTIPPYLCALWSIPEGSNELAASCIRDVVLEEMLHVTLVCNLLNAIGGSPRFTPTDTKPSPAPDYPTYLPHSDDAFIVDLRPFSPEALETFLKIEQPATPKAPPEPDKFHTIGQFYEAVLDALEGNSPGIFTNDLARQVDSNYYYGGGGEAFPIHNYDKAKEALDVIIFQGEGLGGTSIWDPDQSVFGEEEELAHFFRFDELYQERRYVQGDTPTSGPTGDPILIDYGSVLPMRPNPKA
jgi:Ferritin-like